MGEFLLHLVVTALLLLLVARIVPGVAVEGALPAVLGALVLGLVNAIVKPVLVILTLPITIVTLGLFYLVVNALVFWLAAAVVPGFAIRGFGSAFLGALLLSVLNLLLAALF